MINKGTISGIAVLPDGVRIPYKEYIGAPHSHWIELRNKRYAMDGFRCVFCRVDLPVWGFQTHHITYDRLGHESLEDIVTTCNSCHEKFHSAWKYAEYYKEQDYDHWKTFSLPDTAKLCAWYKTQDFWFGGDLNCCSQDTCRALIDMYFIDNEIVTPVPICPEDIQLYFRNKRYEMLFDEEARGMVLDCKANAAVEAFLDEHFGKKGGNGGNKKRADARAFMTRHSSESLHRNYWYLWHINKLMKETRNYE